MSNVIDLIARRGMTETDAFCLLDIYWARMTGWSIAIGADPVTGRTDFRTRRARAAGNFDRDVALHYPDTHRLVAVACGGGDIVDLWPDAFRPALRFRLRHAVPRARIEPLSEESRKHRREIQGLPDWPAWLDGYATPAHVADHPPLPALSALFRAWEMAGLSSRSGDTA